MMTRPDLLRLLSSGARLAPASRQAILDEGPAAVPELLALLDDEQLALTMAPGGGYVPIHAATLLAELKPLEAIAPMLRLLGEGEPDSILHDTVARCLPAWGAAVLEPALRALDEAPNADVRSALLDTLAKLGVRDERVFAALLEELGDSVALAANHLSDYGDERAIAHLERAAEALDVGDDGEDHLVGPGRDVIELHAAVERLGGTPSASLSAKLERVRQARQAFFAKFAALRGGEPKAPAKAKVGRNDPCPCGSGKKYKKCCWLKDRAPPA